MNRAEVVDREESAKCDSPTVTKVVTRRGRGWGFWGKGRLVSVWLRPDRRFQVTVYRPHPLTIVKDFVTDEPPRTVAQALAIEL